MKSKEPSELEKRDIEILWNAAIDGMHAFGGTGSGGNVSCCTPEIHAEMWSRWMKTRDEMGEKYRLGGK